MKVRFTKEWSGNFDIPDISDVKAQLVPYQKVVENNQTVFVSKLSDI